MANISYNFMPDGGEMGAMIRSKDWAATPLGARDSWPVALKLATGMLLGTPFPMYIAWGPQFIQLYNDGFRPILGSAKHPDALGISTSQTFSEIWQIIGPMFRDVMIGRSVGLSDLALPINRNGYVEECHFNFSYSPLFGDSGEIAGVLVTVIETTEQIRTLDALRTATRELEAAHDESERQGARLKRFLMEAPAGVCILDGPELVFELVNPGYQQLFPGRDLLGRSLAEALSEIREQPIWEILQHVYNTGELFEGKGLLVPLAKNDGGPILDRYFDFIYQPRHGSDGSVDGILVFVYEVTDMIVTQKLAEISSKKLEKTEDSLRLALNAARLGTFDMDLEKGTMEWDERCRTLFGITHQDPVTFEKDFTRGLHPEDRDRILSVIKNVFVKTVSNGNYDVEFRTVGAEDSKTRWVRAMGKADFDERDRPLRFVGAVLDITELKQDELRKDDFIGIVSHELKTPLTSLNAYTQLLQDSTTIRQDKFVADVLDRVHFQVKKMNTLINGFLNTARLESGKIYLENRDFNLDELVKDAIEESRMLMATHEMIFKPCEPILVCADRDKIGSVIANLLSNATKYSEPGTKIEVDCKKEGQYALVSVRDEGMGIPQSDFERLFERYYRVEYKRGRHISGFGIGLYLSAEIIHRHNGKIWVESEVGKGSTFYFTIPSSG
jgi:two-component system sensor histidine kinase VicK